MLTTTDALRRFPGADRDTLNGRRFCMKSIPGPTALHGRHRAGVWTSSAKTIVQYEPPISAMLIPLRPRRTKASIFTRALARKIDALNDEIIPP